MKRIIAIAVLLVVGLSVGLTLRLRQLNAYRDAPPGGTGTVEGTEINITARIAARITAIHVKEGDRVNKDDLLVELECAEPEAALAQARAQLAAAESAVQAALAQTRAAAGSTAVARRAVLAAAAEERAAEADMANAEKEVQRLRRLHASGASSASQLDRLETTKVGADQRVQAVTANRAAAAARVSTSRQNQLAAEAQVEAARRNAEAMRAAVRRAQTAAAECRLTAPRAATVQTRAYEPGEVVLPGANLLTLVFIDEVRATFYLPNAELAAAAPGKRVTVRADAYPRKLFSGVIRHVSAKAEFTPKNVQTREDRDRLVYAVEVAIPNPDGSLRPGMPVEVAIRGSGR